MLKNFRHKNIKFLLKKAPNRLFQEFIATILPAEFMCANNVPPLYFLAKTNFTPIVVGPVLMMRLINQFKKI